MKKLLFIIVIFLSGFSIKAQDNGNQKGEKLQALKIAFITQRLQLTTEEAQRFWPVYNQYQNEIKQVNLDNRNGDAIANEEKILNIKKRYQSEFIKVIGQPKAGNFFNAEKEFRGALMRNLKNRPAQQRPMRLRK